MQDRSQTFKGLKTVALFNRVLGTTLTTDSFQIRESDTFDVTVGPNSQGNRITPLPNAFTHQWRKSYTGIHTRENSTTIRTETGPIGSEPTSSSYASYNNNLYNEALGDLYDQLRSGVDLSIDLLQAGQTSNMVRNAMRTVDYVRSFSVRNLRSYWADFRRIQTRDVGGRWLEFQYGWKPLAQSIYDSSIILSKSYPPLMKIRGRATERMSVDNTRPWQEVDPNITDKRRHEVRRRAQIVCTFKPPVETAQLLSRFTSLNPVSIAWELTPYSFVVDWFLDVGGFLRAQETALLFRSAFLSGFSTEGFKVVTSSDAEGRYTSGGDAVWKTYKGSRVDTGKRRIILGGNPLPRPPQFRADLGASRLLNAAALLSQFLGRR